jgi:hypothetical protein
MKAADAFSGKTGGADLFKTVAYDKGKPAAR